MTGGSSVISEYGRCFFLDLRREGRSTTEAMQNLTQVFVLTEKKKNLQRTQPDREYLISGVRRSILVFVAIDRCDCVSRFYRTVVLLEHVSHCYVRVLYLILIFLPLSSSNSLFLYFSLPPSLSHYPMRRPKAYLELSRVLS